MKKINLSVFFPCYNEEKNLEKTIKKAIPVIKTIAENWEIIIVNDGSKDKTGKVALKLKKEFKNNISIITHNPNRGYGAALKSGFYNSKYDWIAFTDSDGQFDFSEINKLIKKQNETKADVVIGNYLSRQVSPSVILTSKIWEIIVYFLFSLRVKDIDCGFKLISKKVIDSIPRLEAERGAFISSEFLIKTKNAGFKIAETGIHHYPRTNGKATGRQFKVIFQSFVDLFSLWIKLNKTNLKHFISYSLIGFTGATLDFLVFLLFTKVFNVYFLTSNFISVSIGIINNYILNIFFNFKVKDKFINRFIKFYSIGLLGLGISSILLYVLVSFLNINSTIAKLTTIIFIVIIQYSLNKKYSFKL